MPGKYRHRALASATLTARWASAGEALRNGHLASPLISKASVRSENPRQENWARSGGKYMEISARALAPAGLR